MANSSNEEAYFCSFVDTSLAARPLIIYFMRQQIKVYNEFHRKDHVERKGKKDTAPESIKRRVDL